MDEGLEAKIGAILNDPEQMEKISALAMQLMGSSAAEKEDHLTAKEESKDTRSQSPGLSAGLGALLGSLGGGTARASKSEALLLAMRPYLRPGRQAKLDKALRISRVFRLAGTVMKEYGGGTLGL